MAPSTHPKTHRVPSSSLGRVRSTIANHLSKPGSLSLAAMQVAQSPRATAAFGTTDPSYAWARVGALGLGKIFSALSAFEKGAVHASHRTLQYRTSRHRGGRMPPIRGWRRRVASRLVKVCQGTCVHAELSPSDDAADDVCLSRSGRRWCEGERCFRLVSKRQSRSLADKDAARAKQHHRLH